MCLEVVTVLLTTQVQHWEQVCRLTDAFNMAHGNENLRQNKSFWQLPFCRVWSMYSLIFRHLSPAPHNSLPSQLWSCSSTTQGRGLLTSLLRLWRQLYLRNRCRSLDPQGFEQCGWILRCRPQQAALAASASGSPRGPCGHIMPSAQLFL